MSEGTYAKKTGHLLSCGALAVLLCGTLLALVFVAQASARTLSDDYIHGTIAIDSDADEDGVITIGKGQSATISISPFKHVQYKGCYTASYCPDGCGGLMDCFIPGMGCMCGATPCERSVSVTTQVAAEGIISVSEVVADATWKNEDNLNLSDITRPVTKDGTITLTALETGETTLTVSCATDEDGSIDTESGGTSTLVKQWRAAEKTYTVCVVDSATETDADATKIDISGATVTLDADSYTYTGSAIVPTVTVTLDGTTLTLGTDYTVAYSDNTNVGTATVTVTGWDSYSGSATKTFTIAAASSTTTKAKKKAQKIKITPAKKVFKAKKLKKKAQSFKIKIKGAKGKVKKSFKIVKKNKKAKKLAKKIKVTKAGKVTLKKGAKKGVYKIKVTVKAAGNKTYKAKKVTKTITVKVK